MRPLLAYTTDHVRRLAGLSTRTLQYWEETDIFHPSYVDDAPHRPYRRLYTFQDIVSLRTLADLRRVHKVELDELRRVGRYLRNHYDHPWSEVKFKIAGRHVVFDDPSAKVPIVGKPLGQQVILFDVEDIERQVAAEAAKLRERSLEDIGQLSRHRYVLHNAWVVAGTRIPTSAIWNYHQAGYGIEGILNAYPELHTEDIEAAIRHEESTRTKLAS